MINIKTNKRMHRVLILAILLSGLFAIGANNAFAANVHVFNFSGQAIQTLRINNLSATSGSLEGWGQSYQPKGIIVPRSPRAPENLDVAAFSQDGSNQVFVEWEDTGQTIQFSVGIAPHNPAMNEDFLLFINPSQAILFDQFGEILETYKP